MARKTRAEAGSRPPTALGANSLAFLLAQLGAHAAGQFAARVAALGLAPPDAGVLRAIGASAGLRQQALAQVLGVVPSRLVVLIDELEGRGLVERRDDADDRRAYALHLTPAGREMLAAIGRVAQEHQAALCAALDADERAQLAALLRRVADQQGLVAGVHPGFARLGRKPPNT